MRVPLRAARCSAVSPVIGAACITAVAAAVGATAVSTPERCAALSHVGADIERRLQAAAAHR